MAENKAVIEITGDASGLSTAVQRAQQRLGDLETSTRGIAGQMTALFSGPGGIAAAALAAGAAIAGIAKSAVSSVAALDDLSEKTSLSVEQLDKLSQVATVGGHELDGMASAAAKLAKTFTEALGGDQNAAALFRGLGVEIKTTGGVQRDFDSILRETAAALATAENKTVAVAYAQKLFGKSGAELMPMLADLADAGELNSRVSTEQAAAAERAEKAWNRLKLKGEELKISLVNELAPAFEKLLDYINKITKPGGLGKDKVEIGWLNDWSDAVFAKVNSVVGWLNEKTATIYEKLGLTDAAAQYRTEAANARGAQQRQEQGPARRAMERDIAALAGLGGDGPIRAPGRELDARAVAGDDGTRAAALREAERLRQLDLKGWVAHAEAVLNEAEETDRAMAQIHEDRNKAAERLREEDVKGWVAYAEAVFAEAEASDRRNAEVLDQLAKENQAKQVDLTGSIREATDWSKEFGLTMSSSLEDIIVKGGDARTVIQGLIQDIAKMVIRQTVTQPVANLVGSGIQALGSLFTGYIGAQTGNYSQSLVGASGAGQGDLGGGSFAQYAGRAIGGPAAAGSLYRVNETQMEYFRPNVDGQVIPMGSAGVGGALTVQQNFYGVTAQSVRQMMMQAVPSISKAVESNWAARRGQGGGYARA